MTLERKKDYLTIIIGLISGVKFRFIGTFYAGEILIYILLFNIGWSNIKTNKYAWNLFKLAWLWLGIAIITDIFVDNDFISSIKGEFNIIFFLFQFPVVYWLLYDKPVRFLYYLIAIAIVSIPNLYLFGPEIDESQFGLMGENIWLYYSLVPIAIAFISWLYYKGKIGSTLACIMMIGFGFYMLFHNSRNLFLTMTMAAVLLSQISKLHFYALDDAIEIFKTKIVKIFLLMFIGMLAVSNIYENLASSGTLGAYAYRKYMLQSSKGNLLEGGRGETLMGIELIKRKPILGYGSFAIDEGDQFHREYAIDHNLPYKMYPRIRKLPAHSHIVGAWMENGIGGGLFWGYVLYLFWKIFKSGAMLSIPVLLPALLMTFTTRIWEIMFSPFGLRIPETFFLMFLTIIYMDFENKINYETTNTILIQHE